MTTNKQMTNSSDAKKMFIMLKWCCQNNHLKKSAICWWNSLICIIDIEWHFILAGRSGELSFVHKIWSCRSIYRSVGVICVESWNGMGRFAVTTLRRRQTLWNFWWKRARSWWWVPADWAVNCWKIWPWWVSKISIASIWTQLICPIWIGSFCFDVVTLAVQRPNVRLFS